MERTDEAYYVGYGFFAEGGYLDLFAGDFVLGYFRRLFGNVCRKIRSAPQRSDIHVLFRKRLAGYGICIDAAQPAAVISFLRRYRRYRSGNRLYYAGVYTGKVVPQ